MEWLNKIQFFWTIILMLVLIDGSIFFIFNKNGSIVGMAIAENNEIGNNSTKYLTIIFRVIESIQNDTLILISLNDKD